MTLIEKLVRDGFRFICIVDLGGGWFFIRIVMVLLKFKNVVLGVGVDFVRSVVVF